MGSFSQDFNNDFDIGLPGEVGMFRFLKDHFINNEYILAGETRMMFDPWTTTGDVEPLNWIGTVSFYNQGPILGGVWRTVRRDAVIYPPVTYWRQVAPNSWGLTGLGSGLAPIFANISRVEDKEV